MINELEIKAVIAEFMQANRLFTSVDIANHIKKSGTFIRNRDVATYLRNQWFNICNEIDCDYQTEVIMVGENNDIATFLYLPFGELASNYTETNQKALSPDDLKKDEEEEEKEEEEEEFDIKDNSPDPFQDSSGRTITPGDYVIYTAIKTKRVVKGFVTNVYFGRTYKPTIQIALLEPNRFSGYYIKKHSYNCLDRVFVLNRNPYPPDSEEGQILEDEKMTFEDSFK